MTVRLISINGKESLGLVKDNQEEKWTHEIARLEVSELTWKELQEIPQGNMEEIKEKIEDILTTYRKH